MKRTTKRRPKAASLPLLMANLTLSSWETISRRTLMIAQNRCSPLEYQRMYMEKAQAAAESAMTLFVSGGAAPMQKLLAPWSTHASKNAKRLRKKRR